MTARCTALKDQLKLDGGIMRTLSSHTDGDDIEVISLALHLSLSLPASIRLEG